MRIVFRCLTLFLLAFITAAALLITKWPLAYFDSWGLLPEDEPCEVCTRLPSGNRLELIAHAGGELDGQVYTNSLEAIQNAIAQGYKFIEVDLRKTLDNHYYGAHKTREFNEATDHEEYWIIPPTSGEVRERELPGGLTPVLLADLVPIFREHPDVMLVTDKASDYRKLLEEFPLPDQLLVEVGSPHEYAAAKLRGIRNVAANTDRPENVLEHGYEMVVVRAGASAETMAELKAAGAELLVASFEDCDDIPDHVRAYGSLVYVDRCEKPAL